MREYEVTIIIRSSLEEEPRNQLVELVTGWLTQGEGDAAKPEMKVWGERRLAYPIGKQNSGYYVLYDAKLDPASLQGIERNFQYNEDIIRYLVVRKDA